jgi:hypothetical protein
VAGAETARRRRIVRFPGDLCVTLTIPLTGKQTWQYRERKR